MGKRLILWIAYLMFSFVLAFGTLGGGDGSRVATAIFYSWACVFAYIMKYNVIGMHISYVFYLSILFFLTMLLGRQKNIRGDLALVCFYLSGSLISVVIAGRAPDEPLLFFLSSFITSVVIVIIYLVIDWRLARGPKRSAATTDGA